MGTPTESISTRPSGEQRKEAIEKMEQENKEMQATHLQAYAAWKKREQVNSLWKLIQKKKRFLCMTPELMFDHQALQDELTKIGLVRDKLSEELLSEHREQLHKLLGHNTTLLQQQHSLLNAVPTTLQVRC